MLRKGRGIPHCASLRCSANAAHCPCGHAPCPSRRFFTVFSYVFILFRVETQLLTS
ncbi:MAG: hypothetical protein NZ519_03915 [Bacteroidia bacterium]|nr:hypothetical protein [Bacteroidia bacterium]